MRTKERTELEKASQKSGKSDKKKAEATLTEAGRMMELAEYTSGSFKTKFPTPFGSEVVETATQKRLVRCLNHVGQDKDPSQHAEVHAVRKACKKLKSISLKGYTLYTTCEPCPMCMSTILWAGIDRVVFGSTIEDASKVYDQIYIPAEEVAKRSDMKCTVTGPIARDACAALFVHPGLKATYRPLKTDKKTKKGAKS